VASGIFHVEAAVMLSSPLMLLAAHAAEAPDGADAHAAGAAAKGDVAAFERLYRAHVNRVFALCLRLVADRPRAEQLTQDAFVRAWERIGTFRGEAPFGAWMREVTLHVVFADKRATSRRLARVAPDDDQVTAASSAAPRTGDRLDLERAIATLPEGARTVFVLHDVEGYGHEEIGKLLGIAEGTSKAHLHKARTKLKEALG
jgi:RNA polymerase sigma-70 factor (ECF subfamily)